MNNIAKALIQAQGKIFNASKDGNNPHFKSKYATLESVIDAVKPAANEAGIAIIQSCGKDSEGHFVETDLIHVSGEKLSSKVYLVLDKQNMQSLGSSITYGRRYTLAGMFAIGQEDDDAEKTMSRTTSAVTWADKPVVKPTPSASPSPVVTAIKTVTNTQAAIEEPIPSWVTDAEELYGNASAGGAIGYGAFICEVGKKYAGQSLDQIGKINLFGDPSRPGDTGYIGYLIKSSQEKNKPLDGKWLDFVVAAEKYANVNQQQ